MKELHNLLCAHFEHLYRDRDESPVYFIEHGLTGEELDSLSHQVSAFCKDYPISLPIWRDRYFPLIILATEVGYNYRGPGNDFWSRLEEVLSSPVSIADRQALSELFRKAAESYNGAVPIKTPWTTNFPHIAWPITHALLPVEFHRPLSQALLRVTPRSVDFLNKESLYTALKFASRELGGVRFQSLINDKTLLLSLSCHFLKIEGQEPTVSKNILIRITRDLRRDKTAARNIDLAHRQSKTTSKTSGTSKKKKDDKAHPLMGNLYLRNHDYGKITLEALMPSFSIDAVNDLQGVIRKRKVNLRLWGVSNRLTRDNIVGYPIGMNRFPDDEELANGVLLNPESLPVKATTLRELHRVQFNITPPIIFRERESNILASQHHGDTCTEGQIYWLLTNEPVEQSQGIGVIGKLGEMTCARVDLKYDKGLSLLKETGLKVRRSTSYQWVGAPPCSYDSAIPEFYPSDNVILSLTKIPNEGVHFLGSGEKVPLYLDSPCFVDFQNDIGDHSFTLSSEGSPSEYRYRIKEEVKSGDLCWASIEGEDLSLQSLLSGGVTLRIDGVAPFDGLRVTLSLMAEEEISSCTIHIPPLPVVIKPNDKIWARLLSEQAQETLKTKSIVKLKAVVGNQAITEWVLERRLKPCWWEKKDSSLRLVTESGYIPLGVIMATNPTASPLQTYVDDGEGFLKIPVKSRGDVIEPETEFEGIFITPTSLDLRLPKIHQPRISRTRESGSGDSLGVEQLITALLRWRLSEGENLIAEIRRKQIALELERWMVRVLCGDKWANLEEQRRRYSAPTIWESLIEQCRQEKVGFDTDISISKVDEEVIGRYAEKELQESVPDLWLHMSAGEVPGSYYEELDLAFGRAYEVLAANHRSAGRVYIGEELEDADPGYDAEDWDKVLFEAQKASLLHEFAELIIPTDGAEELVNLDYGQMHLEDLINEVQFWRGNYQAALQGKNWSRDEIDACLSIWLHPVRVIKTPWRSACERFATDRWTCRAIRYVALRREAALSQNQGAVGSLVE